MGPARITGEEVIDEILSNMREGVEPLRYTVLVPGLYHIYLHERDFNRLQGVFPQVIKEVKQALNEELDDRNRQGSKKDKGILDRLREKLPPAIRSEIGLKGSERHKKYQPPAEGWQISFHKDLNGELLPGDICVQSQLTLPTPIEFGAGNQTKTIKTLRRNGVSSKTEEKRGQRPSAIRASQRSSTATEAVTSQGSSSDTVYALIHYEDKQLLHTFEVVKNQIVIGRGGSGYWVDLSLDTDTKISREHLRLRRDEQTGKFYVKDLSTFGTTINGQPLPSSMQSQGGERRDADIEVELPPRARIGLAGTFILDFEVII
jgi:hypothetical protein